MPGYIMAVNFGEVWPLLIFIVPVIAFIVYVTIDSNKQIAEAKKAKAEKEAKLKKDNRVEK